VASSLAKLQEIVRYFFFFRTVTVFASGALGASPSIDFTGQILTIGHLLQPATMAMGQTVILISSISMKKNLQYAPD
jgi:hypothetical protein